jgi:hypothetical protein
MTLLSDAINLDDVDVNGLRADQEALAMLPSWVQPRKDPQPLTVRRLKLRDARLSLRDFELPSFDGDVTLLADGSLARAMFTSGAALRVEVAPKDNAWRVTFDARNWQPPLGPAITFDELSAVAMVDTRQATFSGVEGKIGPGAVKGAAKASWGSGIRVEGEFTMTRGDAASLLSTFTRAFSMTGSVNTNGAFMLQAASLKEIFDAPKVDATFAVEKGELNNVDIVRAIQSISRDGQRGGKTRFDTLAGT